MIRFLKRGDDNSKFLGYTKEYLTLLNMIKNLEPIIAWVRHSIERWNGKIAIENSQQTTVLHFLAQDKINYDRDLELFDKMAAATE